MENMSRKELLKALEPYGVPYRLTLTVAELRAALARIQKNEALYGSAERPHNADVQTSGVVVNTKVSV
jgi:hypothetical protein